MSAPDENFDKNKMLDLFAFLMESLYLHSQSVARTSSQLIRRFFENVQIADFIDSVSDKLAEHPILRFVVLATALSCVIPVIMFIVFGIVSLVITFAGFLFIEGTLLAMAALFMFISIVSLVMVMSILAMSLGFFYVVGMKLGILLNRFESTSNLLRTIAPSIGDRLVNDASNGEILAHED